MKVCLGIIFICLFSSAGYGQDDKYRTWDSLFETFRYPRIPDSVKVRLEEDRAILCIGGYYTTDTLGNITSQTLIPFPGIGNAYEPADSIWQIVMSALETASKQWVIRPMLWNFKYDKAEQEKLNKRAFQRPYHGKASFFIIFEVSDIEGSIIHQVSFVSI